MAEIVYLVEHTVKGKLEVLTIKTKWHEAHALLVGGVGTITAMRIDEEYPDGLSDCPHWHYRKEDKNCEEHNSIELACNECEIKLCLWGGGAGDCPINEALRDPMKRGQSIRGTMENVLNQLSKPKEEKQSAKNV